MSTDAIHWDEEIKFDYLYNTTPCKLIGKDFFGDTPTHKGSVRGNISNIRKWTNHTVDAKL